MSRACRCYHPFSKVYIMEMELNMILSNMMHVEIFSPNGQQISIRFIIIIIIIIIKNIS